MGHANLTNISKFFINRLYANGKLSLAECVEGLVKAKEYVSASEGRYYEPEMLGMAMMEIISIYQDEEIIEFVDLSDLQRKAYDKSNFDGLDGEEIDGVPDYEIFDSIIWKFSKGWRKRYKEIELVGNVTN